MLCATVCCLGQASVDRKISQSKLKSMAVDLTVKPDHEKGIFEFRAVMPVMMNLLLFASTLFPARQTMRLPCL